MLVLSPSTPAMPTVVSTLQVGQIIVLNIPIPTFIFPRQCEQKECEQSRHLGRDFGSLIDMEEAHESHDKMPS